MRDYNDFVEHYISELKFGNSENAFFCLIEADPSVVPLLQDAFNGETNSEVCASIIDVISHFRLRESLPFLAKVLEDARPEVRRSALDGLVAISDPEAISILENVLKHASTNEYREWVREALEQAKNQGIGK